MKKTEVYDYFTDSVVTLKNIGNKMENCEKGTECCGNDCTSAMKELEGEMPVQPTKTCITLEDVQGYISSLEFIKMGKKTTVGLAVLKNGFEIVESAACVDPASYDSQIGEKLVRQRIENKIWELLGFNLSCNMM